MTREEAIRKHRKMWMWLADNPGKFKEDYLEKFDPEVNLENDCYLCVYCTENDNGCNKCLLKWPNDYCASSDGLFGKWTKAMVNGMKSGDYTQAAEIARQIANLPEKEETK